MHLIPRGVIADCIAVGPAVDREAADIPGGIEAAGLEDPAQLVAHIAFKGSKRHCQQFVSAEPKTLPGRDILARQRNAIHPEGNRIIGRTRRCIVIKPERIGQAEVARKARGAIDRLDAEVGECPPVVEQYRDGHQGHANRIAERVLLILRQFRTDVRNDRVITGKHTIPCPYPPRRVAFDVGDLYRLFVQVFHVHDGRVEADFCRRLGQVQPAIVKAGGDNVVHGVARGDAGDQSSNEKSCDRRIAVREMEILLVIVWLVALRRQVLRDSEAFGARQAVAERRHRGCQVDAVPHVARAPHHKEIDRFLARADNLFEKVEVSHAPEFADLFLNRNSCEVVRVVAK